MNLVSTPYEASGRVSQKQRTRSLLVDAAKDLVAAGTEPTVDLAARAAGISRTTAYRYFPNQRLLILAAHPEMAAASFLPPNPPPDALARLDIVVRRFVRLIIDTESAQRTMLRLSLESEPTNRGPLPLRQGRAIAWIGEALEPLRGQLSETQLRRLSLSIRSVIGIEALVWLTDIGGLSREAAAESMQWSARALLAAATGGPPPPANP
jgi:AcrR family transcriptional regulator